MCRFNVNTNQPECIPFDHPCAGIYCPRNTICRVRVKARTPYCDLNPCYLTRCANCHYIEETDSGVCLPPVSTRRLSIAESQTVTTSQNVIGSHSCEGFKCPYDHVCQFNELIGFPKCVKLTIVNPLQRQSEAKAESLPNTVLNTEAEAEHEILVHNPCAFLRCPLGSVCQRNRFTGFPECVPLDILIPPRK